MKKNPVRTKKNPGKCDKNKKLQKKFSNKFFESAPFIGEVTRFPLRGLDFTMIPNIFFISSPG
jgi:hypothetical protein